MKRLPNNVGSITKLSGNRAKPFMAREGKTGQQRCIGTFRTYEEAMTALGVFNNDPWNIDSAHVTMETLFSEYLKHKGNRLGESTVNGLKSAYNHCKELHRTEYTKIKVGQMQRMVDECDKSKSTKATIKNLFRHLDLYARELDISNKMYSEMVKVQGGTAKKKKTVFSDCEIDRLWEMSHKGDVDSVLFMLYTGFRISEMLDIRVENVHLEEGYIIGGMKTEAGRDRMVPIHHRIYSIVEKRAERSTSGYLFEQFGRPIQAQKYRYTTFAKIMRDIGAEHTPHECRHTFRSRLDSAGASRVCIDKMMGHASGNVGEDVYTHKSLEELKKNIEKIA